MTKHIDLTEAEIKYRLLGDMYVGETRVNISTKRFWASMIRCLRSIGDKDYG